MGEQWDADLESKVRAGLRADASTLEPRADWDGVRARATVEDHREHSPSSSPSRFDRGDRRPLAAAAAAVLALAVGAVVVAGRGGDEQMEVTGTDPTVVPTSVPATATTSAQPTPGLRFDVDWSSLPDRGVLIVDEQGVSRLFDLDGRELASTEASADPIRVGPGAPGHIVVEPDENGSDAVRRAIDPAPAPAPPDCAQPDGLGLTSSAGSGGAWFSVCGTPTPDEIWRHTDGGSEVVSGPPTSDTGAAIVGSWRDVEPSPDGRWILAQWSGECEVPQAYLFPAAGGALRALGAGAAGDGGPASQHLGWTPDGQILSAYPAVSCGEVAAEPGVYLEDPATGARTLVVELRGPAEVVPWTKRQDAPEVIGETGAEAWGGVQEDIESGVVTAPGFNDLVRANRPSWAREPLDAVEVLLGLDARTEEVDITVTPSDGDRVELSVTLTGLMDDSAAAIRYEVTLVPSADGLLLFDSASWSQQCRRGTDTTTFRPGFCP